MAFLTSVIGSLLPGATTSQRVTAAAPATVTATVRLTPVNPKGRARVIEMDGPWKLTGGVGGWEQYDRARRDQAVEYVGTPGRVLTGPVIFDGMEAQKTGERPRDDSVEDDIIALEALGRPTTATSQPPVLQLAGPVPHRDRRWVLQSIDWDDAPEGRPGDGQRVQQRATLTFFEYEPGSTTLSPAKRAAAGKPKKTTVKTVLVRSGDDLRDIAAREYGHANQWRKLANANGLHDWHIPAKTKRVKVP